MRSAWQGLGESVVADFLPVGLSYTIAGDRGLIKL